MTESERPDIDRRLREAFEDDAATAVRIARIALSEDEARGRGLARAALADEVVHGGARTATGPVNDGARIARPGLAGGLSLRRRYIWAAAATTALVLLAIMLVPRPQPAGMPAPDAPADAQFVLSGTITDGILVVPMPDGSVLISGGEGRSDRLPDGVALVVAEGESR
jgi:hypothetical protein